MFGRVKWPGVQWHHLTTNPLVYFQGRSREHWLHLCVSWRWVLRRQFGLLLLMFLETVPRISPLESSGHKSSAFLSKCGWWIGRNLGWLLQIHLSIKQTHRAPVPVGPLNSEDLSHLCNFSVELSQSSSVAAAMQDFRCLGRKNSKNFVAMSPILPRITQTCCVWLLLCHIVHSPTLCSVSHFHRVWIVKDSVEKNKKKILICFSNQGKQL